MSPEISRRLCMIPLGELEAKTFNKPICNVCYEDLRETLIVLANIEKCGFFNEPISCTDVDFLKKRLTV